MPGRDVLKEMTSTGPADSLRTEKSYCRFCHALCGIEVDVQDGRVVEVRGDRENPYSQGFICVKGRQLPNQHNNSGRISGALKRRSDGTFESLSSEQAMDEVAEKLQRIIAEHGPRAVALYNGTKSWCNVAHGLARSWLDGIGSPSYYTTVTIDQPLKVIAGALHGQWGGGHHDIQSSDVAIFVGSNPLRSFLQENLKLPCSNANRHLGDLVKGGLQLIVIDPRRTESAQKAALHLQVRPGEDPTLLAGIVREILAENLHDAAFVAQHAEGLDALRAAVEPFTLDYVERRARVPAAQVAQAARLFGQAQRGGVVAGTGPNMAPHPLATELLICALNTLCGRYRQAGEVVGHAGVLGPAGQPRAQAISPYPFAGMMEKPRVRDLSSFFYQQPTPAMADEILTPGEGRIRALICHGGNPAVAFPDQPKVIRAMKDLDLLVCLDVVATPTVKLADYVFGCKLSLEKPDYTRHVEWYLSEPFAQYTPAVVEAEGDLIDEWEFFWGMAHRMRVPVSLGRQPFGPPVPGQPVNIDIKPTTDELMDLEASDARILLDEVRPHPSGALFEQARAIIEPADPATAGRFSLAPPELVQELAQVRAEPLTDGAGYAPGETFTHRLIARRMLQVFNSTGSDLEGLNRSGPGNPAFMNPEEMKRLGIVSGKPVEIQSSYGRIRAIAKAESDIPEGVISISHSWGDLPELEDVDANPQSGACTNRLVADDRDYEPLVGMCRMSAIPVNVRAIG
jgi:anaerobic selenocysteine-containing dehydrogenase